MIRKFFDSPWPYFTAAALILIGLIYAFLSPKPPKGPEGGLEELPRLRERGDLNVVFILIDTLRADRMSVYGYERQTTPIMQALASRGILFKNTHSQSSWTKESMASLWVGMYPERTGVRHFSHALPQEAVMPAEIFKEAGYQTAGVWRNGWVANNFGFDQGFDLYIRPTKVKSVGGVKRTNPSASALQGTDADATLSAQEFIIGASRDRPFFLYVHYMDIHQYLYTDTSPNWGTSYSDIYDAAIHWTDVNIGNLVAMLEYQELLNDTVIVIASDHGEAFHEHGEEGHARAIYRETQLVPFMIIPPLDLSPGIVVDHPVANVDIWPTVLDMLGLPPLPDTDGKSLMPLVMAAAEGLTVPEGFESRPLYSQLNRAWGRDGIDGPKNIMSVLKDGYRLIQDDEEPVRNRLYDYSVDPLEETNLYGREESGEKIAELGKELETLRSMDTTVWGEADSIEIDEMEKNQLRALGYMLPGDPNKGQNRIMPNKHAPNVKPVGQ